MSRLRIVIPTLFTAVFSSILCFSAQAEETSIQIITPVPAPKEAVIVPKGYISCFTVSAGWYKGLWYPERRICQYDQNLAPTVSTTDNAAASTTTTGTTTVTTTTNNAIEGDAWVESYWVCTKYLTEEHLKGQCTNWDWRPGHWVKTLSIY